MLFFLDTNIIIRFLTNDDEIQSRLSYKIFEEISEGQITGILTPLVITECTWVLQKAYGYEKQDIATHLQYLILAPGIKTIEEDVVLQSLESYTNYNIDFVDAYLGAKTKQESTPVLTWNSKDFQRQHVECYSPKDILSE